MLSRSQLFAYARQADELGHGLRFFRLGGAAGDDDRRQGNDHRGKATKSSGRTRAQRALPLVTTSTVVLRAGVIIAWLRKERLHVELALDCAACRRWRGSVAKSSFVVQGGLWDAVRRPADSKGAETLVEAIQ